MQIEMITADKLSRAEAVLSRGFPDRPVKFWGSVLASLEDYRSRHRARPVGNLLVHEGRDVGVLLTLESATAEAGGRKVNLSSWYVEEEARFYAPLMLRTAVSDAAICTDLTPTEHVRALNDRLGITRRTLGSMIVPALVDALRPSRARVRGFEQGDVAAGDRLLLADHVALGLHGAVISGDGPSSEPLIFMPTTLRGVPGARLIYCRDLESVRRNRGAIARFLLSRGLLFLEIEANRAEKWPGALHSTTRCVLYAKGALPAGAIDHSYSELAFIHTTSRKPS